MGFRQPDGQCVELLQLVSLVRQAMSESPALLSLDDVNSGDMHKSSLGIVLSNSQTWKELQRPGFATLETAATVVPSHFGITQLQPLTSIKPDLCMATAAL